jgi:hypothetical protein
MHGMLLLIRECGGRTDVPAPAEVSGWRPSRRRRRYCRARLRPGCRGRG